MWRILWRDQSILGQFLVSSSCRANLELLVLVIVSHLDALAGVAVPPAPHAQLQPLPPGEGDGPGHILNIGTPGHLLYCTVLYCTVLYWHTPAASRMPGYVEDGWIFVRCCLGAKMKFIRIAIGGQVIFSAAQQGKIGFLSQCRKYRETKKKYSEFHTWLFSLSGLVGWAV